MTATATTATQPCILIVDDDPDIRASLARELHAGGYLVLVALDGAKGLELLRRHDVAAVIADYEMPLMDGLELLQRVRMQQPEVFRVLLTGHADLHVAMRALNEKAVDRLLLKPWDRVDLLGMLRLHLHVRGRTGELPAVDPGRLP